MPKDFDDETTSIGMGPVSFDVAMARDHGWLPHEIQDYWDRVTSIYQDQIPILERRYPDRHVIAGDGSIMYVPGLTWSDNWTHFERRDIEIAWQGDRRTTVTDAYVVGYFAAHPEWNGLGRTGWDVTHLPTGLRLPLGDLDEYEAKRIICHLHRVLGDLVDVRIETCGKQLADERGKLIEMICAQVLAFEDLECEGKQGFIA